MASLKGSHISLSLCVNDMLMLLSITSWGNDTCREMMARVQVQLLMLYLQEVKWSYDLKVAKAGQTFLRASPSNIGGQWAALWEHMDLWGTLFELVELLKGLSSWRPWRIDGTASLEMRICRFWRCWTTFERSLLILMPVFWWKTSSLGLPTLEEWQIVGLTSRYTTVSETGSSFKFWNNSASSAMSGWQNDKIHCFFCLAELHLKPLNNSRITSLQVIFNPDVLCTMKVHWTVRGAHVDPYDSNPIHPHLNTSTWTIRLWKFMDGLVLIFRGWHPSYFLLYKFLMCGTWFR